MQEAALICHPATPSDCIERFEIQISLIEGAALCLRYTIVGQLGRVRMPVRCVPHRGQRLWEHTCMEAFFRAPGSTGYCEFNFAPSTVWAAYTFDNYRRGMRSLETALPIAVEIRTDPRRWELEALIGGLANCLNIEDSNRIAVGISAVIESTSGEFSYWALQHPSDRPDFHHPDGFALTLDWPAASLPQTTGSYP